MIRLIDTYAYGNKLRSVSPLWKCGFTAAMFVLSYMSHPAVQLLTVGWMCLWTVGHARIPMRIYAGLLGTCFIFYAASLPAVLIEIAPSGTQLPGTTGAAFSFTFAHWTAYIPDSGVHASLLLLCRTAACVSCLSFMMLTTPVSELLQVMKWLRMPSLVIELMLIMYRFLFLLDTAAHDMYTAQMARGGHSGFKSRLADTASLVVRLFTKTMQRYKQLANGLIARGFTDEIHMAPYRAVSVPARYWRESCAGIAALLLVELWLRWRILL
ncbi:cobalt ECF transporter T component CbiQ [Paenibacillus piri]|uniref:Cobalt ECF transporter T component CbiQ n=1 Tax=Paenibacillus piri TaxID=2547395 RepID=A0A4R5KCX8_9BACL|nr:cobalt ECF transporter T component CbiQ [Paenibacillus piri]TDF93189.1 cobalt ECF transporter T component CbiQ [Paenibacillus piri]